MKINDYITDNFGGVGKVISVSATGIITATLFFPTKETLEHYLKDKTLSKIAVKERNTHTLNEIEKYNIQIKTYE